MTAQAFIPSVLLAMALAHGCCAEVGPPLVDGKPLFTREGRDPSYESIKEDIARNPKAGVSGSKISLDLPLVETLPEAKRPIAQAIRLHTLLNSAIGRDDFPTWSRWYQEQGSTQIFRLFKGEVNMHSSRSLAGRVEAFSKIHWKEDDGKWHEWSGVITPIRSIGSNLQVKNNENDWAVMIHARENGTVTINHRRGADQVVATEPGRPVLLQVRDNGLNYEVFIDRKKVGEGSFKRPSGTTAFRWGMYVGANEIKEDAMILFSGVTIDGGL